MDIAGFQFLGTAPMASFAELDRRPWTVGERRTAPRRSYRLWTDLRDALQYWPAGPMLGYFEADDVDYDAAGGIVACSKRLVEVQDVRPELLRFARDCIEHADGRGVRRDLEYANACLTWAAGCIDDEPARGVRYVAIVANMTAGAIVRGSPFEEEEWQEGRMRNLLLPRFETMLAIP